MSDIRSKCNKKMGQSSFPHLIGLVLHIPGVEQGGVLGSGNHLLHLVQDKGHERGHLGPCSIRQLLRTKAVNPYPLCPPRPAACCAMQQNVPASVVIPQNRHSSSDSADGPMGVLVNI